MQVKKLDIAQFLDLLETITVIDVRSPSEFAAGHIPGAVNIPLFDDSERAAVGTKYKKEGRIAAIIEGLERTGPSMAQKLKLALENARENRLLVHCWRGGMRSEAMAWLFSMGDIETGLLEGGYKSYRNHVLDNLSRKRQMIILGGMTGSSKTHILRYLRDQGEQVIDLEALACHKGSAFGALGQPAQPSTEQFANDLHQLWRRLDESKPVWLEDESRNIGSVFLPDKFFSNMQESQTVVLEMDTATRLPRLVREYSIYPPETLKASILKIARRLGGDNTSDALTAVDNGDIIKAIEISLGYYDKAYRYSLKRKENRNLVYVGTDTDDIAVNAMKVLETARSHFSL